MKSKPLIKRELNDVKSNGHSCTTKVQVFRSNILYWGQFYKKTFFVNLNFYLLKYLKNMENQG